MRKHNDVPAKSRLVRLCLLLALGMSNLTMAQAQTYENSSISTMNSRNRNYSGSSLGSTDRLSSSRSRLGTSSSSRSSSRLSSRSSSLNRDDNRSIQDESSKSDYATSRDRRRNRNKANNGTKNPPSQALEQGGVRGTQKSTVVKRKGEAKQPAKGGTVSAPLAPIKISPSFKENALYFNPAFAQLQPGDLFATALFFYNSDRRPAAELDLWLKYDPTVLDPEWVDTKPIEAKLENPAQVEVWREDGYVHLHGMLAKPLLENVNPLPIVHWRAIGAIGATTIIFKGPDDAWPAIYAQGDNLIKPINLGKRPLAQFNIGIAPPETKQPGLRMIEMVRDALPQPVTSGPERVRLVVQASGQPVRVGQTGLADVCLLNPQSLGIDTVRFRLLYNPAVVQILDADEDNYITDGINLFDGDYHEKMYFDQHFSNNVDPIRGVIDYSVGSASGPRSYPGGPFARIVYRVLKPDANASFRFQIIDPATHERITDIGVLGRSLLGSNDEVAREALHGTYLPIAG